MSPIPEIDQPTGPFKKTEKRKVTVVKKVPDINPGYNPGYRPDSSDSPATSVVNVPPGPDSGINHQIPASF